MCRGAKRADGNIQAKTWPVADGGEGTLSVYVEQWGDVPHEVHAAAVKGPRGNPVHANFIIGLQFKAKIGIVELAQAAGFGLVPTAQRDPTSTTTFGVGELVQHAVSAGAEIVLVAIGGSATVDGGCGLAQALGARFFDAEDRAITQPMTGRVLRTIARIERPTRLPKLIVLCDVMNPLLGEHGAARVYGPQKGATPEQVEELERGLAHLASIAGGDVDAPGAGAAGGAGFGLMSLCGAELRSGIEWVLSDLGFKHACSDCDLVLTGEGRLDAQSLQGKACMGVANAAANLGVPTIAIVGSTGPGAEESTNHARGGKLQSYVSLVDEFGEERALRDPAACIEDVAERVVRDWRSRNVV